MTSVVQLIKQLVDIFASSPEQRNHDLNSGRVDELINRLEVQYTGVRDRAAAVNDERVVGRLDRMSSQLSLLRSTVNNIKILIPHSDNYGRLLQAHFNLAYSGGHGILNFLSTECGKIDECHVVKDEGGVQPSQNENNDQNNNQNNDQNNDQNSGQAPIPLPPMFPANNEGEKEVEKRPELGAVLPPTRIPVKSVEEGKYDEDEGQANDDVEAGSNEANTTLPPMFLPKSGPVSDPTGANQPGAKKIQQKSATPENDMIHDIFGLDVAKVLPEKKIRHKTGEVETEGRDTKVGAEIDTADPTQTEVRAAVAQRLTGRAQS